MSVPRYMAGVKHVLSEAASGDGHCYLAREELLTRAAALLEAPVEAIAPAIDALTPSARHSSRRSVSTWRPSIYAESGTARRLRLLLKAPSALPPARAADWQAAFDGLEAAHGLALAERQREAVQLAYHSKVMVLTGGPGVGKTTTLRALLDVLDRRGVEYALAAPTGRAAKRMTEATGRPAATLHRLLEFQPRANDFAYNERRPLPQQFVIVDEVSMLDILLAYRLVRAVAPEAHLLLVGDADQLPSVGPGSVLADILKSAVVPQIHLTELFRQAQREPHHRDGARHQPRRRAAGDARSGRRLLLSARRGARGGAASGARSRQPAAARALWAGSRCATSRCWRRCIAGRRGCIALNAALQERLNPHPAARVAHGGGELRAGDKVMQVRNNYDRGPSGVFNGDVGMVVGVDEAGALAVAFSEEDGALPVFYEPHELDELTLAYACSIHRAQGSEYPCVVLPLVMQHYLLLQRNLVYTAITRARRLCVVVGDRRALERAVANDALAGRNTSLADRLRTGPSFVLGRPSSRLGAAVGVAPEPTIATTTDGTTQVAPAVPNRPARAPRRPATASVAEQPGDAPPATRAHDEVTDEPVPRTQSSRPTDRVPHHPTTTVAEAPTAEPAPTAERLSERIKRARS